MSAPPAQGARVAWLDVPEPTRSAIEDICGAAVIEARTQPGGFSPGVAARLGCADETRWFVKAASAELNPDTPQMHRQEAKVLAGLDPLILTGQLPVPRLRGTLEYGPWFALIVDDVDGRQPVMPWRDDELGLVLAALDRLGGVLAPAPVAVRSAAPAVAEYLGAAFSGWRTLARTPGDDRLDPWSRARLGELAALEATWETHAAGGTLLHADIRADNLLLTDEGAAGDRVMVVDWPHACRRLQDLLSQPGVLAHLKSDPGPLGLDTLLAEIGKLSTVRALGLDESVFAGASDRIVTAWRARAARMYPSDFGECGEPVRYTLLAALCWTRQAELVDGLVELLIGLIHRINARAERRVEKELIGDLARAGVPSWPANKTPAIRRWARRENVGLCFTPTNASWANPIDAQFGPVRTFVMGGSDHRNRPALARAPASAANSEQRWGRPKPKAA